MDNKKIVLLIIFSTSLLFLWDAWIKEEEKFKNPPAITQTGNSTRLAQSHNDSSLPVPGNELISSQTTTDANGIPASSENKDSATPRLLPAGEQIRVVTDRVIAEIDTMGGDLRRLELLQQPSSEDKNTPYALLHSEAARTYVAQSGLVGEGLPNHKTTYRPESDTRNYELLTGEDKVVIRLLAPENQGVQVIKTYTFHRNSYVIDVGFEIENRGNATVRPFAYFQMLRDGNTPPAKTMMIPSYLGAAVYTEENKYQKIPFSDLDKGNADYPTNANDGWIAMLEHYFLTAWLPQQQTPREYFAKRQSDNLYTAGVIVPAGAAAPGETITTTMPFYAGPEEQDDLAELAPGLELTVDYGWLTMVAKPLFRLLSFYHSWIGNWGIAIILLTMTVKLLFFPLSAAGYRSMAKLRLVTPKLQRIQEQYKGDRQRMHQAMMEFYQEEKINPMGGCLPILVQIPVFIALYWTILAAVELRYAPFALWINDLSSPDPYYLLPTLLGISMFVQTKLNPTPTDPIQAKVMQIMPIAFSAIFFFFPAGLVLYSLVNNILSIAQQWQITKMYGKPANKDETGSAASKPKKIEKKAKDNKRS
ncbi:membrane protein insertase YidC [Betaproteobacteria bacterium PRO4]|uniref:membrane protein insertase YidC n=1 Tax=Nitrosomonas sp. TaxID=42353 RepID=UPI00256E1C07|nr:membrane protein insertase YidC [Nitrosomonas sp.]MBE7526532.1 membrane protein insertase YidC [Burkholderiales bacterium]MDL1866472.1 membrane protein insertase YidC [Betaproteobacteria bacterium PRO4]